VIGSSNITITNSTNVTVIGSSNITITNSTNVSVFGLSNLVIKNIKNRVFVGPMSYGPQLSTNCLISDIQNPGDSKTLTITGGIQPYAIAKQPDSTLGTAILYGPTLIINTLKTAPQGGNPTTIVIIDSSSPTKRTLTIGPFNICTRILYYW
jgi:hypothetical protein